MSPDNLFETKDIHQDMVNTVAYAIASRYAKIQDDYFFIYIKKKPKYIPEFIYRWFLKRFVVLNYFKKID